MWVIKEYNDFFSNIIKVNEESLIKILEEKSNKYNLVEIPKKNGLRKIYILDNKSKLYSLQKEINENFFNNIMISDCCYGFKKECNYIDFLEPHKWFYEERYYLRLDVKNFFESISYELLHETLSYYIEMELEEKEKVINYIIDIITYKNIVVQGARTSPIVSNLVFRQLDIRIEKYCNELDIEYTRYADDLLFSSKNKFLFSKKFIRVIRRILYSKNFKLNFSKIRRGYGEFSLNGYVIGNDIKLSRKKLEQLSTILFYVENNKFDKEEKFIKDLNDKIMMKKSRKREGFLNITSIINYLAGNRAFLISVYKYLESENNRNKIQKFISRTEKAILKLYEFKS